MSENVVAQADAEVMQHEAATQSWKSLSFGQHAYVRVLQNTRAQQFRIVASLDDERLVLNTPLYFKMHYKCATPTFHQWRDEQKRVYGLNFPNQEQARVFDDVVKQVLELIARSREDYGQVMMHANGHVEQAVYQEPHAIAGGGIHHGMHSAPVMREENGYNRGGASLAATQLALQQQQRRQSQGSSHSGGGGGGGGGNIYAQVQQPNGHAHLQQQQQQYAAQQQQQLAAAAAVTPPRPAVSSIPPAPPPPPPLSANAPPAPPPPPPPPMNGGLAPIASNAPPPPPPPPPMGAAAGGGGRTFLDDIKNGPKLRKTQPRESLPVNGLGGVVENGGGGGAASSSTPTGKKAGGGDLMSELMQTMSRRKNTRAALDATDNKSNISNGSSDSGNGTIPPPSGLESNGGSSNGSTNGLASNGSTGSGGTVKRWPDPTKPVQNGHDVQQMQQQQLGHRKIPSASSIFSDETRKVSTSDLTNGGGGGGGLSAEQYDRLKNDILGEIRTEMEKMKREIIDAITANR